ncbi:DUF4142 domain-containing protein [Sphingobacterium faecium]|uniref:DUF4142 domain-containing protein n=1 Tax=Sphingobacterium faecium TaxID=34087 RepID=UPI0024694742|nr:DUF4142 domain-containing protein [Sphingobacterium faecium]MDH5826788.1 DUF4142 domain-containing protein [Sphingobacterium faecium]
MGKYLKLSSIVLGIIALLAFKQQNSEKDFLGQAYLSNHYEISIAQLAREKSNNDVINAYAELLIDDHQKIIREFKDLAKGHKMKFVDGLGEDQKKHWDMLNSTDSTHFNQTFKELAIASHEQTITLFVRAYEDNAIQDIRLKNWISNRLPLLRAQLDQARDLRVDPILNTAEGIPPHTRGGSIRSVDLDLDRVNVRVMLE